MVIHPLIVKAVLDVGVTLVTTGAVRFASNPDKVGAWWSKARTSYKEEQKTKGTK